MEAFEPPVIQTERLAKSYGRVAALKDLDLVVPSNSIFGFLGPNGAGKTTTMKLLVGLSRPTGGGGTIFGKDIVARSAEIRARTGYLPQHPRFPEYMSAREVLRFVAGFFFEGPEAKIEARVDETLELVRLEDKGDRLVGNLSGGELQRLGIAQAQVNYPDLLILDEPAASLDPIGRRDVLEIMRRLREHATVFYSTHILDDVQQVSDTVAILRDGELAAQGPIERLLAGGGNPVYVVTLKGATETAFERVSRQPWVSGIEVASSNGATTWQVSVTDEKPAEEKLARLVLSDPEVVLTAFGPKKHELEEVFMGVVEGGEDAEHARE